VARSRLPVATDWPADRLPLRVPDDYPMAELRRDAAELNQIRDLSDGQHRLADVLAAQEWRRVALDAFLGQDAGDKVLVDVTGLDAASWSTAPEASIGRGLLAIEATSPSWVLQRAGQNAHLWPGFRDQPVFTRHYDDQFGWLTSVSLHPTWLLHYLAHSGLRAENVLLEAGIAQIARTAGPEHISISDNGGQLALEVPTPDDFLLVTFHPGSEVGRLLSD